MRHVIENLVRSVDSYVDLSSLPKHRLLRGDAAIDRLRTSVPFDNVLIAGLDIDGFEYPNFNSIDSDLPPTFMYSYWQEGLFRDDPFIVELDPFRAILTEVELYKRRAPSARLTYLLDNYNIYNRTYFLLRRNHVIYGAVGFTRTNPFSVDEQNYLRMVAKPLHQRFTQPIMKKFSAETLKLNAGEIECLQLASVGLTTDEMVKATGYQASTINTYLQWAAKKLGAKNRSQAVAEAIRRGLIE